MKEDFIALNDRTRQRYNVESDVSILEAAEEQPGLVKYVDGRCKVLIESKASIDKFILAGCIIDSVDSLQVCGLDVHFGNTTLVGSGLYAGFQFYSKTVDNSLHNITKYLDLAFHLICFYNV